MLKRMVKTVLNIVLFICILMISYLTIIRGLFPENVQAQTNNNIDISAFGDISKYSNSEIHGLLDDILKENNLPPAIIDEVLESEDTEEMLNDYVNEIIISAGTGKELPEIPSDKIESLLNQGIQKYNQKYNANISLDKVKGIIENFTEKVEATLSTFYKGISFLSYFQILFNNKLYYGFLITTIILILIMAICYKKEFLFSLGGITIFNGIFLILTYCILKADSLKSVLSFLPIELKKLQNNFFTGGIIFIITGILLLIMYRIVCVLEEKRKKGYEKKSFT